jgi:hypothetical protein
LPAEYFTLKLIDEQNQKGKDKEFDLGVAKVKQANRQKEVSDRFTDEFKDYKKTMQIQYEQFLFQNEKGKQK